eukprot:scaffold439_cov415-Prasinococcus_capsulatus_cf.AAC.25
MDTCDDQHCTVTNLQQYERRVQAFIEGSRGYLPDWADESTMSPDWDHLVHPFERLASLKDTILARNFSSFTLLQQPFGPPQLACKPGNGDYRNLPATAIEITSQAQSMDANSTSHYVTGTYSTALNHGVVNITGHVGRRCLLFKDSLAGITVTGEFADVSSDMRVGLSMEGATSIQGEDHYDTRPAADPYSFASLSTIYLSLASAGLELTLTSSRKDDQQDSLYSRFREYPSLRIAGEDEVLLSPESAVALPGVRVRHFNCSSRWSSYDSMGGSPNTMPSHSDKGGYDASHTVSLCTEVYLTLDSHVQLQAVHIPATVSVLPIAQGNRREVKHSYLVLRINVLMASSSAREGLLTECMKHQNGIELPVNKHVIERLDQPAIRLFPLNLMEESIKVWSSRNMQGTTNEESISVDSNPYVELLR